MLFLLFVQYRFELLIIFDEDRIGILIFEFEFGSKLIFQRFLLVCVDFSQSCLYFAFRTSKKIWRDKTSNTLLIRHHIYFGRRRPGSPPPPPQFSIRFDSSSSSSGDRRNYNIGRWIRWFELHSPSRTGISNDFSKYTLLLWAAQFLSLPTTVPNRGKACRS